MTYEQHNIWTDPSNAARACSNSSVIPIFQHKDGNSGQYGGISRNISKTQRIQRQDNHTAKDKGDDGKFQDYQEKYEYPP